MAWYRTGTVAVTNGSAAIVGTGTAFVANVIAGEAIVLPDGRSYEIASVNSDTSITLASNYLGATASGQAYAVLPTQSFAHDLALAAAALLSSFADVRDGPGEGLWPDGSAATPAFRFASDQDTGFYRIGSNSFGLSLGGTLRVTWATTGQTVSADATGGAVNMGAWVNSGDSNRGFNVRIAGSGAAGTVMLGTNSSGYALTFGIDNVEKMRVATDGKVGIGTSSPQTALHVYNGVAAINNATVRLEGLAGGYGAGIEAGAIVTGGSYVAMGKAVWDGEASWNTTTANQDSFFSLHTTLNGTLAERLRVTSGGRLGIGTTTPTELLTVGGSVAAGNYYSPATAGSFGESGGANAVVIYGSTGVGGGNINAIVFNTAGNERARINASGMLLVGATSGSYHTVKKAGAEGNAILGIEGGSNSCAFFTIDGGGYNAAGSGIIMGKNASTSRSINAGGTINASGADYAEYMHKAPGCGTILKGDVCGVDVEGKITDKWAHAAGGFVVKSTDPAYVGGDTWGTEELVGARPIAPVFEPPAYDGPLAPDPLPEFAPGAPVPLPMPDEPAEDGPEAPEAPERSEGEGDVAWAQRVNAYVIQHAFWLQEVAVHGAALAAYPAKVAQIEASNAAAQAAYEEELSARDTAETEHAAAQAAYELAMSAHAAAVSAAEAEHVAATSAFEAALAEWEAGLEAARQTVDRIAFCGQAPVNVAGDFAVGDYVIAAQDGAGIKAVAVTDPSDEEYRRRIGKIWAIRDDRPWVDVQHG